MWRFKSSQAFTPVRHIVSFVSLNGVQKGAPSRRTDLLQTEDERLGALDLVDLPSFTHRLLDDVAVVVVILETNGTVNGTITQPPIPPPP